MKANRFCLLFFCVALSRPLVAETTPTLSPAAVQRIDAAFEAWESQSGAPASSLAIVVNNQLAFSIPARRSN
jgi:hypothetical protein